MTASYALSPRELDAVVEDRFADERLAEWREDDDAVFLVVEDEGSAVALGKGTRSDGGGAVEWLFVDPEHRGQGHATELLDTLVDELGSEVRALALAANSEGEQFFERFDFERVDEREVEYGGENLTEHVYSRDADADERVDDGDETAGSDDPVELPDDGRTTDDGVEVSVEREESRAGTKAPFFATYVGSDGERHGFFCSNCGGTNVAMDSAERLACDDCGNEGRPDGSREYDEGYL